MKRQNDRRSRLPVPVRRHDSVDVLERVLTKGAQVKGVDAAVDEDADHGAGETESGWLRITVAGVDLLNVQTDLSWRSVDEPAEPRPTTE